VPRDITTVNLGRYLGRFRIQRAVIFIRDAAAIDAASRCSQLASRSRIEIRPGAARAAGR
jgi:hypothetical protein